MCDNQEQISRLESILNTMDNITVTKYRPPKLRDKLAVRHGRYIQRDADDKKTFRFVRDELGLLVDFMAEIMKKKAIKIGIRGMPQSASVCANKRWLFVSSTLIKQTVRSQLIEDEYSDDNIFILDGIVSTKRANERHWQLVREIMRLPATKVVEHPDVFVSQSEYTLDDFDYIIELRNDYDEEIQYNLVDEIEQGTQNNFSV